MVTLVSTDESTESFIVYTDKTEYEVGETINIYAKAVSIDPDQVITVCNVTVYDSDNLIVADWSELSMVLTDTITPQ